MGHRSFIDRDGVRWTVSVVEPESADGPRERRAEPRPGKKKPAKKPVLATRPVELPWLCFQSKSARLRLTPVAAGWKEMTDVELEDLMADSTPETP